MESVSTYAARTGGKNILMNILKLICQMSDCYFGVRNYWGALAKQFWGGYYDPEVCFPCIFMQLSTLNLVHLQASWTCGDSCLAPEDQVLECSECEAGLQLSLQQLSNQEVPRNSLSLTTYLWSSIAGFGWNLQPTWGVRFLHRHQGRRSLQRLPPDGNLSGPSTPCREDDSWHLVTRPGVQPSSLWDMLKDIPIPNKTCLPKMISVQKFIHWLQQSIHKQKLRNTTF